MAQKINQKQFVNIVKEAITKTLKESGFNGYDMQPQTPMTKQQQIDASWKEFNDNNKNRLAQQQQDANVGSYLDSNINTDDLKGQLGMDAMSNDKNVADIAQMTKGTPRQTGQRYDNYLKRKYMESKKRKFNMTESQLNKLIKECITEVLKESHIPSYEEPVFIGCSSPNDADVSVEIGYSDYSSSLFYVGECGTDGYAALAAVVEYLVENGIIDHYAYSEEDLEAYAIEDFIEVEGYYLPSWQIHMHQLIDNHGGRRR